MTQQSTIVGSGSAVDWVGPIVLRRCFAAVRRSGRRWLWLRCPFCGLVFDDSSSAWLCGGVGRQLAELGGIMLRLEFHLNKLSVSSLSLFNRSNISRSLSQNPGSSYSLSPQVPVLLLYWMSAIHCSRSASNFLRLKFVFPLFAFATR